MMTMIAGYKVWFILLVAGAVFALGTVTGRMMGRAGVLDRVIEAQEQTRLTAENGTRIINARTGERDQCRAEVEKINATNAALSKELSIQLMKDRTQREAALKRIEESTQLALASSERLEVRTQEAREIIATVQDACVRAGAPPSVVELLNYLVASPADGGDGDGSDGGMPTSSRGN